MQDTKKVAKALLGKLLVRHFKGELLVGEIVETEAYLGKIDPCCHSFKGKRTKRNEAMYLEGGHSYVYFTYGCITVSMSVVKSEKEPEAVLIRALKPLQGLNQMKKNRKKKELRDLCSGPAKLCQAFGIDKSLNGVNLLKDPHFLLQEVKIDLLFPPLLE